MRSLDDYLGKPDADVIREHLRKTRSGKAKQQDNGVGHGTDKGPLIAATPFVWIDPAAIPLRRWVYGRHYQRGFLSQTVAPSGFGKSTLVMVEALSIITGLSLLGLEPVEKAKVWYWGEDPMDELQRQFAALMLHFNIDPGKVVGRLFVDSGRKSKITIAEQTKNGAKVVRPVVDALIATIRSNAIGVMMVDPFLSSHGVPENDNAQIDVAASAWADVVEATDCAGELVHHSRKTGGAEITGEDGRGASSLGARVRAVRTLNVMTDDEAAKAGVQERRSYFRVDRAKGNKAPPSSAADWYQLRSYDLPNGRDGKLGDSVGVVDKWKWPNALDGVTVADLRAVQTAIAAGSWRANVQAKKDWAGVAVAKVLGLDVEDKADQAKIADVLKIWIKNGMFVVVERGDERSRVRPFLEVGQWAND